MKPASTATSAIMVSRKKVDLPAPVAAGAEVAEALEAVGVAAGVEVAEAAAGFGPMGAAELVWRALDVHQSGGVSRRRLQCTPIRRRVGRRCHG
jgi:hypothetical protein